MKAETLELIFSILEYSVSALLGYAGGNWKRILVFIADLLPILRTKLPPVYNKPTNPGELAQLRWQDESGQYRLKRPLVGAWIV